MPGNRLATSSTTTYLQAALCSLSDRFGGAVSSFVVLPGGVALSSRPVGKIGNAPGGNSPPSSTADSSTFGAGASGVSAERSSSTVPASSESATASTVLLLALEVCSGFSSVS